MTAALIALFYVLIGLACLLLFLFRRFSEAFFALAKAALAASTREEILDAVEDGLAFAAVRAAGRTARGARC